MATQQTYIIMHWTGGHETYIDAIRNGAQYDFNRVGCKRVETAIRYLKNWIKQAHEKGLTWLYPTLSAEDARWAIVATPDGYTETEIVASGWIKEFKR